MFNKLLKYEARSIWRYWWIIAVSIIGLSFVGAFALRFTLTAVEHDVDEMAFLVAIAMMVVGISIFCILASLLITEILVFVRYYKNFFTDEGYLTFTLPVSRQKMLAAKMLNGLIWTLAHILLIALCGLFIFGIISPPPQATGRLINFIVFKQLGDLLSQVWNSVGGWLIVYIVEALMFIVAALAFSQSLLYFCITFGSVIAKKAKLLAAIGIYYAVNFTLSIISQVFGIIFIGIIADGIAYLFPSDSPFAANAASSLIVLIIICITATLAAIAYFTTQNLIERKLNLP